MESINKLGFIGGGRMAEALIKGIIQSGFLKPDQLAAVDPSEERRGLLQKEYGVQVAEKAEGIWADCSVIILAVKPGIVAPVLTQNREQIKARHLLISIAAGIPLKILEDCTSGSGCRCIRVMPNTPAIVQEGISVLSPGRGVSDDDLLLARKIFDSVGVSLVLDETSLDAVTGLSGSGPAYVFSFLEGLIDAGIKVGLSRPVAESLTLQTVLGAVRLAQEEKIHPAELRAMVTSPGGTTIAGLHELEKGAFRSLLMNAVEAATRRSKELGEQVLAQSARKG